MRILKLSALFLMFVVVGHTANAVEYATWNSADKHASIVLSGGDLIATGPEGGWRSARANVSKSTGKHYFELTYLSGSVNGVCALSKSSFSMSSHPWAYDGPAWGYYNGGFATNGTSSVTVPSYSPVTVCRVAVDVDAGKAWVSKDAVWIGGGDPESGTSPTWSNISGPIFPTVSMYHPSAWQANFGQNEFEFDVPAGFQPGWCVDLCEEIIPSEPRDLSVLPALQLFGIACFMLVGVVTGLLFVNGVGTRV